MGFSSHISLLFNHHSAASLHTLKSQFISSKSPLQAEAWPRAHPPSPQRALMQRHGLPPHFRRRYDPRPYRSQERYKTQKGFGKREETKAATDRDWSKPQESRFSAEL